MTAVIVNMAPVRASIPGPQRRIVAAAVAVFALVVAPLARADSLAAASAPLFQVPLYGSDVDMTRWSTNYFEGGLGYNDVDGDGYKFGQYTGLYRSGAFAIVNGRSARRDDDGSHYDLWGINLGLPSRQLGGGVGTQGKWGATLRFDQLTTYDTDSASFVFRGLGSNTLSLPAGFPGITAGNSQPPANAASILPFAQSGFGVKAERDVLTLGGSAVPAKGWEITGSYNYQKRDGARLTGVVVGSGGGNARAAIVPYALDDDTHQFEAAVRYATPVMQLGVGYWYSRYRNGQDALTWQNPFGFVNGWAAGSNVGFSTGYGRQSLEPDNSFQQVKADFAYNFSGSTRLVATFQYAQARQDEAFLSYTINMPPLVNPGLAVPIGLPASSLNGEVDTTLLDVTFTSRPADRVFVKLKYTYNDRDNGTRSNQYLYAAGDVLNQPVVPAGLTPDDVNANQIRTNLPIGTRDNKFLVDGDFRLAAGTKLRGWYEYRTTDYQVAEQRSRADADVNELGIELASRAHETVNGNLKYIRDRRRGAEYTMNASFAAAVTPPTLASLNFLQLPTLRYFSNADYTQDRIKGLLTVTPAAHVAVQLHADWWDRNYQGPDCGGPNDQLLLAQTPAVVLPAQCQGLTKATGQTYTVDGQYTFADDWRFTAFYTWAEIEQDQAGRAFASVAQGAANVAFAGDLSRNWTVHSRTRDSTVGIGVKWTPFDKPYDAGIQYLYNDGTTAIATAAGAALAQPGALPDVDAQLHSLQVFGKWQVSKHLLLRGNYWFQRLRSDNWSYDNATAVSSNGVLLTGQASPRYEAHVFGLSLSYTGW